MTKTGHTMQHNTISVLHCKPRSKTLVKKKKNLLAAYENVIFLHIYKYILPLHLIRRTDVPPSLLSWHSANSVIFNPPVLLIRQPVTGTCS